MAYKLAPVSIVRRARRSKGMCLQRVNDHSMEDQHSHAPWRWTAEVGERDRAGELHQGRRTAAMDDYHWRASR